MDEFILAIVVGVRFARKLGVLSKSFMRKRFWFFLSATLGGFLPLRGCPGFAFCVLAGARSVCLLLRWHPRFASGLLALPLCGAAPTFLCRRKEK
jgi:hypothetical protein